MKHCEDRKELKFTLCDFKMDNMDDPETNAKISDSAYSNSCSNSQSRRSNSSKSTHSGSHSSGSSGYGGKASTSGSSNTLSLPLKKDKDMKKMKLSAETMATDAAPADEPARPAEPAPTLSAPMEKTNDVVVSALDLTLPVTPENMGLSTPAPNVSLEVALDANQALDIREIYMTTCAPYNSNDGFSCVISMHDGVVLYTTASLTATLGFPNDIWIGRSFIDFVHPKDHKTFSSLITNGLGLPIIENGKHTKGQGLKSGSTMVCRLRRYRSLSSGFGVKDVVVNFIPFTLKFFFKDCSNDDLKVICLVVQATPFHSAFKIPSELMLKPISFVIRHTAEGVLEYIDPVSVPYLGYLPQDIQDENVLQMYHPEDLPYLRQIYECIVKEGNASSIRPYRMMVQNGDYIRVETEWSSVTNPWSMKLEFVIAKHRIIEGPINPDVFQSPEMEFDKMCEAERYKIQSFRDSIVRIMTEVRTKPAEAMKQQIDKRCQDLASFMETLIQDIPKQEEEFRPERQESQAHSYYERDSVMLGGISPHHASNSKSSTETPLSYNQLNYNYNLQRYFDSQDPTALFPAHYGAVESPNETGLVATATIYPSSPLDQNSGDYDFSSNSSAVPLYIPRSGVLIGPNGKLTENMIVKHNVEMEKEIAKMHRETRTSKENREKASNESRKKKIEHLARCNASFQPTSASDSSAVRVFQNQGRVRGVKRSSNSQYNDAHAVKHHCPSPYDQQRRTLKIVGPQGANQESQMTLTTTVGASQWSAPHDVNLQDMFNMVQQMPILPDTPALPISPGLPIMCRYPEEPRNATGPLPGMSSMPKPGRSNVPMPGSSRMDPITGTPIMPAMGSSSVAMPGSSRMDPMTGTPVMPAVGSSSVAMPGSSRMDPMTGGTPVMPAMTRAYGLPMAAGVQAVPVIQGIDGMYTPVYYTPGTAPAASTSKPTGPGSSSYQQYQAPMPYVVQGHPVSLMYGQPYVYPTLNSSMYPIAAHNALTQQPIHYSDSLNLATSNYEEACKLSQPLPPRLPKASLAAWRQRRRAEGLAPSARAYKFTGETPMSAPRRKLDIMPLESTSQFGMSRNTREESAEKTDGESSYSSFYSSFFKTDSGSAEESGDQKNKTTDLKNRFWTKHGQGDEAMSLQSSTDTNDPQLMHPTLVPQPRKLARRKMDAPWNEQVNLAREHVYNYQMETKPMNEVLKADKERIVVMEQPTLVNEQLGQLYLDMHLQGVAARLTLEEGITSSSSSGEENFPHTMNKRKLNKMAIIHEENAPFPPPGSGFLVPESPVDKAYKKF